ncbi:MAG: YqaE/Pmp3 family membrane protein [Alphaproteobacteria bacterium]
MDIIRIILAIFLPPVAAFLTVGLGLHFWLNLILTLIFFVPGMIHALWLVVKNRNANPIP